MLFAESSPLDLTLLAMALALLFGGLSYLFYPAIAAATDNASPVASRIRPKILRNDAAASGATAEQPPLLTLVIPAYDEEERLPTMIQQAFTYLNSETCIRDGPSSSSPLSNNNRNKTNCCKALNDLENLRKRRRPNNSESQASNKNCPIRIEWIVVDDGSRDGTCRVYESCIQRMMTAAANDSNNGNNHQHCWKLISFTQNSGKGAAVRSGMLAASGDFCLMVDADGATDFGPGLEALVERLVLRIQQQQQQPPTTNENGDDRHLPTDSLTVILGSRAHLHAQQHQGRSFIRAFLTQAFHICVVVFVGAGQIRDTQCGFKLFSRRAAHHLFGMLHLRRWAFDTELLFLATHLNYALQEVVVPWHEVEGSKLHTSALNLALVSIGMLRDMVCVRLCYTLGLWKMEDDEQHRRHKSQ